MNPLPKAVLRAVCAVILWLLPLGGTAAELRIVAAIPISPEAPNTARLREEDRLLRVRRDGALESALTVLAHTVPGAATADDFRAFEMRSVLFPAGEAEADVDVGIRDDLEIEPDENFFVRFTDHVGQLISDVEVWIVSNDTTEPTYNPLLPEAVCFQQEGADTLAAPPTFAADGKSYAVWNAVETGNQYLQRHLLDGRVDLNFQRFNAYRVRPVLLSNGDPFVERQETPDSPVEFTRLTTLGRPYPNFQPQRGLGTVLQAGFGENNGYYVVRRREEGASAIMNRLTSAGAIDPTFQSPPVGGIRFFVTGSAIFIVDDGYVMRRLFADGSIDPAFVRPGQVFQVLGGFCIDTRNSPNDPRVTKRLFADGSEVWSFHTMPASTYTGWRLPAGDYSGRFYNLEAIEPRGYRLRRYEVTGRHDATYDEGTFVDVDPGAKFIGIFEDYLYVSGLPSANAVTPACANGAAAVSRIPLRQAQPQIRAPLITRDAAGIEAELDNAFIESAGTVNLRLWRTGPNAEPLRIWYLARNGSARFRDDYVFTSGEIVYGAGISRASISISLINDGRLETDKSFFLDFFTLNGVPLGAAEVTIRNDDSGLAIQQAARLDDGKLRIRFLHGLDSSQRVRASGDLVNWTDFPGFLIEGKQYIDVDPREGTRFFATERFPERELSFP